jgi:hypothetical protein
MKYFAYCLLRQRMKARAFCLSVRGFISGVVCEALVSGSGCDFTDTFRVFNS